LTKSCGYGPEVQIAARSCRMAHLAALRRCAASDVAKCRTDRCFLVLDADQRVGVHATYSNVSVRPDPAVESAQIGRIASDVLINSNVRNMTTSLYIVGRTG
jgi:hypothetical protein